MTPRAVVSDANILIDFEDGGLVIELFQLGIVLVVPDVVFFEELEKRHAHLLARGLRVRELTAEVIVDVVALAKRYRKPSRNDLMSLALARRDGCPLLSGDADLRSAARDEGVEIHGSLWLARQLLSSQLVTPGRLRLAFTGMHQRGRRLPWQLVDALLAEHGAMPLDDR